MRKRIRRPTLALVMILVLWLWLFGTTAAAATDHIPLIEQTVTWRIGDSADLFQSGGDESRDWFAMALGQYDRARTAAYAATLTDRVTALYADDTARITDRQRLALTVALTGGDPTAIGGHDLLADCTYRCDLATLGRQGINGYAFALLVLDSVDVVVPADAATTRDMLVAALLDARLSDGGWALTGAVSDVDMTALVLQALAPYTDRASEAIEQALTRLSALQRADGGFAGFGGTPTAESTAQAVMALCALGLDPDTDSRFVRDGHTVTEALLAYRTAEGGWAHIQGGKPNDMASRQVLCALVALWRQQQGLPRFYRADAAATTAPVTTTTAPAYPTEPPTGRLWPWIVAVGALTVLGIGGGVYVLKKEKG